MSTLELGLDMHTVIADSETGVMSQSVSQSVKVMIR